MNWSQFNLAGVPAQIKYSTKQTGDLRFKSQSQNRTSLGDKRYKGRDSIADARTSVDLGMGSGRSSQGKSGDIQQARPSKKRVVLRKHDFSSGCYPTSFAKSLQALQNVNKSASASQ